MSKIKTKALAPATYVGKQEDFNGGASFELWNLTAAIPGHSVGSTVSRKTLEKAGFYVPPAPKVTPPKQTSLI